MERFNRTLLDMLSTSIKQHHGTWEDHIRAVCMAYNTSVQPTTGFTPFYLMFGRQARIPIDVMFGSSPVIETSPSTYAIQLKQSLTAAYGHVRDKMDVTFERQKQHYNKKVHGKPYNVDDYVWLYSPAVPPGQSKKLHHPWSGPFQIVKRLSDATYRIADTSAKRQRHIVHFDRLKPCTPGTRLPQAQQPTQPISVQPSSTIRTVPFGTNLHLVDDDPPPQVPRRYPERIHRLPLRYTDTDF